MISIEILFAYNSLTNNILFAQIRALIQHYGIVVERRRGLRIATGVANTILEDDELTQVLSTIESHEKTISLAARKRSKAINSNASGKAEQPKYHSSAVIEPRITNQFRKAIYRPLSQIIIILAQN